MMTSPGRVAFTIFGFDVMWYGIMLSLAIISAYLLAYFRAEKCGLDKELTLDIALMAVPAGVIGSRVYYVAFQWDYYSVHLLEILNFRKGGLSIHGALIFGILVGIYVVKRRGASIIRYADLAFPSIALAQSIGRWGNFFNSEAHGGPTDLPWAILVDGEKVHPTFLYESIWCFLLCIFLLYVERKGLFGDRFKGQLSMLYAILYSFERFFVEGLRTDSLMLGSFRQAQVFSVVTIAFGVLGYAYFRNSDRKAQNAPDIGKNPEDFGEDK